MYQCRYEHTRVSIQNIHVCIIGGEGLPQNESSFKGMRRPALRSVTRGRRDKGLGYSLKSKKIA